MKGLIFTYLMTYGGAAVALFNPFYGLLIYVSFAIIKPDSLWFWSVPQGNYSRIVAVAMLIGWAARGFGSWHFGQARGIVWAFLAFWFWTIFSGVFAATDSDTAYSFIELHAKILLPFLVGMTTIRSVDQLKKLAWVLMLSEAYVAYEMNLSYFEGYNRLYWNGFAGMDNNCNAIAMVTAAGLALFLGLAAQRWWQKGLALFSFLLLAHAIMFAFSRGGMLGLIIMGAVAFLLIPKRPVHYALFAAAVMACFQLAGAEVRERFTSVFVDQQERDASAESRIIYWGYCFRMMEDYPLFGVGPGHFPLAVGRYNPGSTTFAHSLWLQMGAEVGLPGLGFLLLFYGICLAHMWRLTRARTRVADPWLHDVGRMVIAAIVGFAISAQFVSIWGLELPYYVVLVGAVALRLNSLAAVQGQSAPVRIAVWNYPPTVSPHGYQPSALH